MAQLQLLNVNYLNNSYEHTIDFESLQAQTQFFDALVFTAKDLGDDYVYIREHGVVDVDFSKGSLDGINYLRFRNNTKWWYAFIVSKDYVNENVTTLHFKIDPIQTFLFDIQIKDSFIVREHQDRLNIEGDRVYNTQPENLGYGENYKLTAASTIYPNKDNTSKEVYNLIKVYCLAVTASPDLFNFDTNQVYDSPLRTLIFPFIYTRNQYFDGSQLVDYSLKVIRNGVTYNTFTLQQIYDLVINGNEKVYNATLLPYFNSTAVNVSGGNVNLYMPNSSDLVTIDNTSGVSGVAFLNPDFSAGWELDSILNPSNFSNANFYNLSIDNTPNIEVESKLYTNPYYYHEITDNNQVPKIFKNEYCPQGRLQFRHYGIFEGVIKDKTMIDDYALDGLAFIDDQQFLRINQLDMPLLNDAWVNYYQANKAQIQTGAITQVARGVSKGFTAMGAMLTGKYNEAGSALSGMLDTSLNIANQMAKYTDIQQVPDSIRGVGNGGQYYMRANKVYFQFLTYSITDEYKQILFDYFTHYGYACNRIKTPDTKSRYYYNYIKIMSANIQATIDDEYITQIKQILSTGITFWHYRDGVTWQGVENYSKENLEMSIYNYLKEQNANG